MRASLAQNLCEAVCAKLSLSYLMHVPSRLSYTVYDDFEHSTIGKRGHCKVNTLLPQTQPHITRKTGLRATCTCSETLLSQQSDQTVWTGSPASWQPSTKL